MNRDFGNEQSMSVHDKLRPNLGPTEEAQDVADIPRNIVPMPAFVDPNNPMAASGSVNMPLNDHPVEHDPDYGKDVDSVLGSAPVENTLAGGAEASAKLGAGQAATADNPEDREEWSKKHWQAQAQALGLPTSGNMDAIRQRVEEHEEEGEAASQLSAEEWKQEIQDAQDAGQLASVRALYDRSGASFSTVESAFEKREAEYAEQSNEQ